MNIPKLIKECHVQAGESRNIPSLLMNIVIELGKAAEAHRDKYFCDVSELELNDYNIDPIMPLWFRRKIKSTFQDHIAIVFILLFDLCGYLGIEPEMHEDKLYLHKNPFITLGDLLLFIIRCVAEMQNDLIDKKNNISSALGYLNSICNMFNIPIEKHITARIAYNRSTTCLHK